MIRRALVAAATAVLCARSDFLGCDEARASFSFVGLLATRFFLQGDSNFASVGAFPSLASAPRAVAVSATSSRAAATSTAPSRFGHRTRVPTTAAAAVAMPDVICYAVAKYNYEPQRDDELRLTKNDHLNVLDKSADGWWKAQVRCLLHVRF